MARLTLLKSETTADQLPMICMVCGRSAETHVRQLFTWSPRWVAFSVFAGHFGYLIEHAALRKMTVEAPVCAVHKSYWSLRSRAFRILCLLTFLPLFVTVLAYDHTDWGVYVILGCLGLFVLLVIAKMAVDDETIRATEITDDSITLTRLCQEFVDVFNGQFPDRPGT